MGSYPNIPNFFVLGAAKCGTSSIYYYLKQHPEIYMPEVKEPHFFDSDIFWKEGVDVYLRCHSKGAGSFPARGEATPGYFRSWNRVIPRIKEVYGKCTPKFILMFRDPVERAWSHFLHCVRNHTEQETFDIALRLEQTRLAKDPDCWCGYFRDGLYAAQLEQWFNSFPQGCFHILLTEDIRNRPAETGGRVFEFIGVDPDVKIDFSAKKNTVALPRWQWLMDFLGKPHPVKRSFGGLLPHHLKRSVRTWARQANLKPVAQRPILDPAVAARLREAYREDILKLSLMINRDLSHWL